MEIEKQKQGKRNRQSGASFELRVRKDLEEKDWIVDKWSNNVEIYKENGETIFAKPAQTKLWGKLIPCKNKFRGKGIPMMLGSGFPDFIAFRRITPPVLQFFYKIIAVECKTNGHLNKAEKEKCKWLLDNQIFSRILIAKKTKVKNKIVIEYKEVSP